MIYPTTDRDRLYEIKVTEPGTWPNVGAPLPDLSVANLAVMEAWLSGDDPRFGIVVQGGTAPDREGVGIELVRRMKDAVDPPVDGFVWSEWDFADNHRMLRSLEDFAKRDRADETWNLYVEYERKFYRLMSREVLFVQGLMENRSVLPYHREFLYNEVARRLAQTRYESERFTVVSVPDLTDLMADHRSFYETLSAYCAVVSL